MGTRTTLGLVAAAALAIAGCGNSSDNGGGNSNQGASSNPSTSAPASGGAATVAVKKTDLGSILTDKSGRTLYLFEKDTGPKSTCSGECAGEWPPLTASGKPEASGGAKAAEITTTKRSDGKKQVVYNGHPLYYYAGDSGPGQTKGEGLDAFGAEWYALNAAGDKVEEKGEDSGDDSSDDSGGSGGGYSSGGY